MSHRSQPGTRVHVTIPAIAGTSSGYYVPNSEVPTVEDPWGITITGPGVVRVEPAPVELPTGFGAHIRADVRLCNVSQSQLRDVLLVLVDADPQRRLWRVRSGGAVGDDALSNVVVLDPGEAS